MFCRGGRGGWCGHDYHHKLLLPRLRPVSRRRPLPRCCSPKPPPLPKPSIELTWPCRHDWVAPPWPEFEPPRDGRAVVIRPTSWGGGTATMEGPRRRSSNWSDPSSSGAGTRAPARTGLVTACILLLAYRGGAASTGSHLEGF